MQFITQLFLYQQFESSCTTTRLGLHYLLPKKQRKNNNGVTGFVSHRCVIHLRSSVPISIVGLLSSASSTVNTQPSFEIYLDQQQTHLEWFSVPLDTGLMPVHLTTSRNKSPTTHQRPPIGGYCNQPRGLKQKKKERDYIKT